MATRAGVQVGVWMRTGNQPVGLSSVSVRPLASLLHVGPINCFSPLKGLWRNQESQEREVSGRRLRFVAKHASQEKRVAVYYPRPGDAGNRSTRGAAPEQMRLPRRPTTSPPTRPAAARDGDPGSLPPPTPTPPPKSPRRPGLSSLARILRILTGRPLRVDRTSRWRKKLHPA